MRISVTGDGILEHLALLGGVVPTPLVHISLGAGYGRALVAGVRLGLFEALAAGELDAEALAARTGCHPVGTRVLANALCGFGFLARRGGRYRLTSKSRRWLLAGGKLSLRDAALFMGWVLDWLQELEGAVRTGQIVRVHDRQHPPEFWESYMRALAAFARVAGPELVRRLKLPAGAARLLDVGGGHGLYGGALCRHHKGLTAEVLDLPPACAVGRRIVAEEGLAEVVRHREGDFRTDAWGGEHDAVLIFNVLHNATAEESQALLRRAWSALRPGGILAVLDAAHEGGDGGLDATAGWNEMFFFVISGAQAWPEPTLRAWIAEAGFGPVKRTRLLLAPQVLLTAVRPA